MAESCLNIGDDGGAGHVAQDGVQVVEGEGHQVAGVVAHQHLVLHRHRHQVVQLVHAVAVELHDGGVRQLVKHRLQHSPAVDGLVLPEYFLYEPPVEHRGHNVIHNLNSVKSEHATPNPAQHLVGPLLLHGLGLESGVDDVDHLAAEVDEEDGQRAVRHGRGHGEQLPDTARTSSGSGRQVATLARRAESGDMVTGTWESQHNNTALHC